MWGCEECLKELEESYQEGGDSINMHTGSESNIVTESSEESRHEGTSKEERSSINMQTGSETNYIKESSQDEEKLGDTILKISRRVANQMEQGQAKARWNSHHHLLDIEATGTRQS